MSEQSPSQLRYWLGLAGFFLIAIFAIMWQHVHYRDRDRDRDKQNQVYQEKVQRLDAYCDALLTLTATIQSRLQDPMFTKRATADFARGPLGMGSRSTLELCAPSVDVSRLEQCYVANDVDCLNAIARALTRK